MEFAKKFILVPNDQITKHVPTKETLSELDREMSAILKNKGISDDEKVKLYIQVLQKRLNILDHNNIVQETISEAPHTEEKQDLVEKSDLMEHLILESAPKNLKSNTRNILNYLKNSQDLMRWTPKGELIYKGNNVKNSNVLDLIKSLQTSFNKAHPPGFDMFLQGLSEMNFPKSFIKNSSLELDSEIKKGRDIAQETKTHKCKIK
ncbi:hypothetical protein AVEN_26817-1 [Araneus ventricosus]|uniref:Uncharacterized protein n=1 Tax=Araneus ventricosus TaxID=182803 RepID=A0A4Y2TJX7_ARAVE|nr:hypothetical protein AVEN_26817-1 [Araneus ventricosus]